MTSKEAIDIIKLAISEVEWNYPMDYTLAFETAIEALQKQDEIEKAQLTHICKSDKDLFPTVFSIFARVICENESSVTIDRFTKFGSLPVGKITISRKDFEKYYKSADRLWSGKR